MLDLAKSSLIKNIITRASEIRDQVLVIKLAPVVIQCDELLANFIDNIRMLNICGAKIIIVHDYTNLVADTLKLFGLDDQFINNLQISNYQRDQIIEMVLSGHINKLIASKLCDHGCSAIGISGKDGNLMQAKKSKLFYKRASEQDIIDIDFISEPIMINTEILLNFEDINIIPVISPIANDENGRTHLLDANLTASMIASSLGADHLILPKDDGLLGNQNLIIQEAQILKQILQVNNNNVCTLLKSAIYALENNTNHVHLIDVSIHDAVLSSMFTK